MTSDWLRSRQGQLVAEHWEQVIALARLIDEVAGGNEIAAGFALARIINDAPVELRRHMIPLASSIDSMRAATRMMH